MRIQFLPAFLLLVVVASAQVPQGFTYQSLVRDASGNPLTNVASLPVRFKIFRGVDSVYIETQTLSTNEFGILTGTVGKGTPVTGTFPSINWSTGSFSLKVEMNFGTGYVNMGANQLFTVPFAMLSRNLASDVPGNLFAGLDAGKSNTFVDDTTGNANTFIGSLAGYSNTTGAFNVALGREALYSSSTSDENTAVGGRALFSNTIGDANTATGRSALYNNTDGNSNTANGVRALYSNTTGDANTASGRSALTENIGGSNNSAFGRSALLSNTTGNNNTGVGVRAIYNSTIGSRNVAVGDSALFNNGVGASFATQSINNTAVGFRALFSSTTGNGNTAIGYQANVSSGSFSNATAIGSGASVNASNKVRIGNVSVTVIEGQVIYTTSDGRFKENVKEDVPGLDFIRLLRPVTYQFDRVKFSRHINEPNQSSEYLQLLARQSEEIRSGFIAQEVEQAAEKIGYHFDGLHVAEKNNPFDNYSLSYSQLVVPAIKAIQELDHNVTALKKENAELKAQLKSFEESQKAKVETLEKEMIQLRASLLSQRSRETISRLK